MKTYGKKYRAMVQQSKGSVKIKSAAATLRKLAL